jgi:hypothetical protein
MQDDLFPKKQQPVSKRTHGFSDDGRAAKPGRQKSKKEIVRPIRSDVDFQRRTAPDFAMERGFMDPPPDVCASIAGPPVAINWYSNRLVATPGSAASFSLRLAPASAARASMAKNYESDITQFIRDLKAKLPDLERKQREGRAIFWDKQLDPDELRRWRESNVPQQPYVYQTRS